MVRIAEPDHREERFVALGRLGDPVQREVGGDVRAFAVSLDHASVMAEAVSYTHLTQPTKA